MMHETKPCLIGLHQSEAGAWYFERGIARRFTDKCACQFRLSDSQGTLQQDDITTPGKAGKPGTEDGRGGNAGEMHRARGGGGSRHQWQSASEAESPTTPPDT